MGKRMTSKDEREYRRSQVATLRSAGYSQKEIATELGVSEATITRDMKALRKQWAETQGNLKEEFDLDLARLDMMLQGLSTKAMAGDLGAIDQFRKIIERRARMFGYDGLTREQETGTRQVRGEFVLVFDPDDIPELSDEELLAIAATESLDIAERNRN